MKKILIIVYVWLLYATTGNAQNDSIALVRAAWEVDTLAPGLVYKNMHFRQKELFASNQHICILEMRPDTPFTLAFCHDKNLGYTSAMAAQHNAIAAVNGSFFDMVYHHPICFLRIQGQQKGTNENRQTPFRKYYQYGTLVLDKGKAKILKTDSLRTWEDHLNYTDVMTAGPLLMLNGKKEPMRTDRTFVTLRHNRTAIGIKPDGTVILLTADGRFKESEGLSLDELCSVLQWLGCASILNLDGGGSTTCYIRKQGRGIVNYPSDNNKFDHKGERKVSNAVLIVK